MKKNIKNKAKITLPNIKAFIEGTLRYRFYYSKWFGFLIQKHIREQIDCRIKSMREICYKQGYCEECGCKTTHLQMANKSCAGYCYPSLYSKKGWQNLKRRFKRNNKVGEKTTIITFFRSWEFNGDKFIKLD